MVRSMEAAAASVLLAAGADDVPLLQPGRNMRDSTNRHIPQGTRVVIALASFCRHTVHSHTSAAVSTYHIIFMDRLSAFTRTIVAPQLSAIMTSAHSTVRSCVTSTVWQ